MKLSIVLQAVSVAFIASFAVEAAVKRPLGHWYDDPEYRIYDCVPIEHKISNQYRHEFFQDHCQGKMCVAAHASYLNQTNFRRYDQVFCSREQPSQPEKLVETQNTFQVTYPKGRRFCTAPKYSQSTYICPSGASMVINLDGSGHTWFEAVPTKTGTVSAYFKSQRDAKGCAVTQGKGASQTEADVFHVECDKPEGSTVCKK